MTLLSSLFGDDARILYDRGFQTLLLANVLAPLGTALVSPIFDSLLGPFGTTPSNIGLMMSSFTAPAIVMIPVAGILADRYGRKPILLAALLLFGTAGAAITYTTDFRVVLALRLLQGVASGGLTPVIITSIGDVYDGIEEATAQGFRFTGSGITQTVFPILSGLLVLIAWQFPFLLYALSIPIAVAVYLWFEEPTARDRPKSTVADGGDAGSQLGALVALLRQRRVLAMVIARGLPMFVWMGFLTYNSIVVVQIMGGTSTHAGLLVALGSLSYAAAASQAGRLSAMFESRLYPLIGANAALGVGFAVFLFAPSLPVAALGTVVAGIGFGVLLSIYRSIITGLASESLRGSFVSLAEAFGRLTATAAPIVMGGIIAATAPRLGVAPALQAAGIGIALVGSVGGVVCLLVVNASPPVRHADA